MLYLRYKEFSFIFMDKASKLISKYFPEEKISRSIKAELVKEKQSIFGIPMSYFKSVKPVVYPQIEIIETANYWFLDLRYRTTIWERLLYLISLGIIIGFFGKVALTIPWLVLASVAFVFIGYTVVSYYLIIIKGLGTKVYKKEWVVVNENSQTIDMNVKLPKYSRDEIIKYKLGSKLFDFLGITISSAALDINYFFKV